MATFKQNVKRIKQKNKEIKDIRKRLKAPGKVHWKNKKNKKKDEATWEKRKK